MAVLHSEASRPSAPVQRSNTLTISAIIITTSITLLLLATLYILTRLLRRRRDHSSTPLTFVHNLPSLLAPKSWSNDEHEHPRTSIASFHGIPDSANLWKVDSTHPNSHLEPLPAPQKAAPAAPPDYIPYRGPIAPPRLPLPAALVALVNRPLPTLPGEGGIKRETYNALGLRFGPGPVSHQDPPGNTARPSRSAQHDPAGRSTARSTQTRSAMLGSKMPLAPMAAQVAPEPNPKTSQPASMIDDMSARVDSILSDLDLDLERGDTDGRGAPSPPSPAAIAGAINGRRQVARVVQHAVDAPGAGVKLERSVSSVQPSSLPLEGLAPPPGRLLNRSQSQKLLSRKPVPLYRGSGSHNMANTGLGRSATTAAGTGTGTGGGAFRWGRGRGRGRTSHAGTVYPFVGYGSEKGCGVGFES